jgi:hypothetical protein
VFENGDSASLFGVGMYVLGKGDAVALLHDLRLQVSRNGDFRVPAI